MTILYVLLAIWLGLRAIALIVDIIRTSSESFLDALKAFFSFLFLGPIVMHMEITEILQERRN